jgi:hypothetical protein
MNAPEGSRALGEKARPARRCKESTPLLPVTRQKIDTYRLTLTQNKLTPWRWFNFRGVEITDFYGKPISISGCRFESSEMLVFWKFIGPFLENAIVATLDETLETCRARNYEPEPVLRETAMLLRGHLIDPIYREMAQIERALRGKGNPKSVPLRDVTDEIGDMERFLTGRISEFIVGVKEGTSRKAATKERPWADDAAQHHCDLGEVRVQSPREAEVGYPLQLTARLQRHPFIFWLYVLGAVASVAGVVLGMIAILR